MTATFATVDDYVSSFPSDVQVILEKLRQSFREVVPAAGERISYQMPTVTLNGRNLVHYAAWKRHIALYGMPSATDDLERELAPYRGAKGTLTFPLRQPIPYDLIAALVEFRASGPE